MQLWECSRCGRLFDLWELAWNHMVRHHEVDQKCGKSQQGSR